MNLLVFSIIGFVVATLRSSHLEGRGLGRGGNLVIAVVGAWVGGFFLDAFGLNGFSDWTQTGLNLFGALAGASVFLSVAALFGPGNFPVGPLTK